MDIKKFIYGHCVHPVRTRIWDTYSQSYKVRELSCGKCLHCKNTRINEWVTRLYAQAEYSAFVYFITLDYAPFDLSSPVGRFLASETGACYHNINSTGHYGMHPLVLCKNHLQDFFKRLRKQLAFKIHYFACGEYGTHAKGRGYGRPHFHAIIFSNNEITPEQFIKAWTINGYQIGRVDFNDLRANGSFDNLNSSNINSSKYVFKYVCKYIQKSDFDFSQLATIDFHRTFFEAMHYTIVQDSLFSTSLVADASKNDFTWDKYVSAYSPFTVCSRRPSIGFEYLQENLTRFTLRDYRLFGLPKECKTFPSYFRRKAKEQLCEYVATGQKSCLPSTAARTGYVLSVLREIENSRIDFANHKDSLFNSWHTSRNKKGELRLFHYSHGHCVAELPLHDLNIFDNKNHFMYQFNGYSYIVWAKIKKCGFVRLCEMDIGDVLREMWPRFKYLFDNYIKPAYDEQVLNESDLYNSLLVAYGNENTYEKFYQEVYARYQVELQNLYKNKLLQQNSKISL